MYQIRQFNHSVWRDVVPNEIIEQLLKNNYTLKALSVTSKSTLNIHEVNTPLDALAVRTSDNKFSNIMKIKGLKCLSMIFSISTI